MTLADILDGAFKLLKANARAVLTIAAAFIVPVQLAGAFAQRNLFGGQSILNLADDPSALMRASEAEQGASSTIASVGAGLVGVLVLPFIAGAVSRVVAASYLGRQERPGAAIRATARRWWALVLAWFLVHLMEGVGVLLCILPGLLVMALSVAVAPAIATEELGPIAGIRRSWRLIRPRLFPVLGIALITGVLASALGGALQFAPQMGALLIGNRWGWPLTALGGILSGLVTTPLVAIISTLVYFDGRIRHEGLDLQVIAAGLAARAP